MTQQPVIYWFRNDLRLHDNPSLQKALSTGRPIVPVFIFDDKWWTNFPDLDFPRIAAHRLTFLYETVLNLSEQIQNAGNHLLIFKGDPVVILKELYVRCDAQAIYAQEEYAAEELSEQSMLSEQLHLQLTPGSMLFTPDQVPFTVDKSPFYYTAFKNKVEPLGVYVSTSPTITHMPRYQGDQTAIPEVYSIPTGPSGLFKGGETAGLERMETYINSGAPWRYSETRNQLEGAHFSSHLAPWLANGSLSVRKIWQHLSAPSQPDEEAQISIKTLKEQLIWRDYFRYLIMRYGEKLFWLKGLRTSEPTMYNDYDAFNMWREGSTGQPLVDALMRELKATGFMSNRGRMLVSFYLSKELKVNWQWGAAWFEYLLVDYDVYSNYGNWAYQSGRGTDSRVNRRFNLKKQAEKFDPTGSFVKKYGSQK
ncbi:DASH family cryptochrome [Geofilum rubicundum]|uniref:Cryptochrome DASH n=1 Tax=Geofilum rubicundum JCM 15548 TaxID=1236989 RepID=A0A0E9M2F9_9BACT|nr:DASH family cryptochrome [Geofilum rubicundum]GAO31315.1 cryptochrome [Geofilum rubicundum JCM 15548]